MTTPEIIITVLLSLLGAALIILTIWLFLASSRCPSKKTELIKHTRFAHRGLHGDGAPENSMTAFRRAIDAGYGIEIDIRLANDGVLVVHHDPTLLRVCGLDKKVIDVSSRELGSVKLGDSNDTVPTFRELLDTVGGRVPLLIEIKSDIHEKGVSEQFVREIDGFCERRSPCHSSVLCELPLPLVAQLPPCYRWNCCHIRKSQPREALGGSL